MNVGIETTMRLSSNRLTHAANDTLPLVGLDLGLDNTVSMLLALLFGLWGFPGYRAYLDLDYVSVGNHTYFLERLGSWYSLEAVSTAR